MDSLSITSLRARNLPRTLLRAPSPSLEFHTIPASPPHTTLPPPSQNTTSPTWHQTLTHHLPPHDTTVGFVIRDTPYPHPPLAHLTISPRRALTQGWFPLLTHNNLHAGDLFVALFCPTRCAKKPLVEAPSFPPLPATEAREGELRVVAKETGRLFRNGRIRIAVTADGVPASAKPLVNITMADQQLFGKELELPADKSASPGKEVSTPGKASEPKRSSAMFENLFRAGVRTGKKLEPAGKALLKFADHAHKRLLEEHKIPHIAGHSSKSEPRHDVQTESYSSLDGSARLDQLQLDDNSSGGLTTTSDPGYSASQQLADPSRRYSFTRHGVKKTPINENENAQIPERNRRRSVNFGSFELALFYGVTPKGLSIQIKDSSSHLPEALTVLTDQKIQLPDLSTLKCTCAQQCNTHLLTFQMSDKGEESTKIVLRITAELTTWSPIAMDNIVTPRFRELMSTIDDMADSFKEKYPQAEKLTYLLVGGLFTKHYPTYFEKNKQFLQEMLRLPRVQTVPIHTEGSIVRNAKIIRDSILKTCRGSKSIVLIGHSKGGIDAISILDSFPETKQFLYGIVSFQAPFGGTFLVDFVARSKLAVTAISSVITSLWKGDQDSLLDMSYSSRAKAVGIVEAEKDNEETTFSDGDATSSIPVQTSEISTSSSMESRDHLTRDQAVQEKLLVYKQIPIVAFASHANFHVHSIRSAADAAGVASMAPAAQKVLKHTGFSCDGLVTTGDARIPHADVVLLEDMMHTEPALYVQGTRYPPGQLTASALALLFEKQARR